MSLFDGTGGDIWSTNAFSFESPMKDLLDGGEYTLEQLLREDELLQEVKSAQPQLIDFLSQPHSVSRLIDYLVEPFDDDHLGGGDDDGDSAGLRRRAGGESMEEEENGGDGDGEGDGEGDDGCGIEYEGGGGGEVRDLEGTPRPQDGDAAVVAPVPDGEEEATGSTDGEETPSPSQPGAAAAAASDEPATGGDGGGGARLKETPEEDEGATEEEGGSGGVAEETHIEESSSLASPTVDRHEGGESEPIPRGRSPPRGPGGSEESTVEGGGSGAVSPPPPPADADAGGRVAADVVPADGGGGSVRAISPAAPVRSDSDDGDEEEETEAAPDVQTTPEPDATSGASDDSSPPGREGEGEAVDVDVDGGPAEIEAAASPAETSPVPRPSPGPSAALDDDDDDDGGVDTDLDLDDDGGGAILAATVVSAESESDDDDEDYDYFGDDGGPLCSTSLPPSSSDEGSSLPHDDDHHDISSDMDDDTTNDGDREERVTLRKIRYPYMACEIVCCENQRIVDMVVDGPPPGPGPPHGDGDGGGGGAGNLVFLDRLFSILDLPPNRVDDRLAGYFEKVLTVLFRMRAASLSEYVNNRDVELLQKFVNHLGSFSIMQVLQKLLLPERTGAASGGYDDDDDDDEDDDDNVGVGAGGQHISGGNDDAGGFRCGWGTRVETASLLVARLIGSDDGDDGDDDAGDDVAVADRRDEVTSHASELLVALVQRAPLDSPILKMLSSHPVLDRIVDGATVVPGGQEFVPHEGPMTSAMNLLEAIVLQLGGFGHVPPVNESLSISFRTEADADAAADAAAAASNDGMIELQSLGEMSEEGETPHAVSAAGGDDVSGAVTAPTASRPTTRTEAEAEIVAQALTWRGLANSEDLTGLLPLALPRLDGLLALDRGEESESKSKSKCWEVTNQMGETTARLGASRLRIVRLLEALVLLAHPDVDAELVKSDVLGRCLDLFFEFEWCNMLHQSVANMLVHVLESGGRRASLQAHLINELGLLDRLLDGYENNEKVCDGDGVIFRLGYMGHLIIICQAIVHACEEPAAERNPSTVSTEAVVSSSSGANSVISEENNSEGGASSQSQRGVVARPAGDGIPNDPRDNASNVTSSAVAAAAKSDGAPPLRTLIAENPVHRRWEEFVGSSLAAITTVQSTPLGGICPPPRDAEHDSPLASSLTHHNGDPSDGGGGMLEMNESDLDIAVSMMEALHLPPRADGGQEEDHGMNGSMGLSHHKDMNGETSSHATGATHHRSHMHFSSTSSGTGTRIGIAGRRGEYVYDDPLGRGDDDDLCRKIGIVDDEAGINATNAAASSGEGDDDDDDGSDDEEGGDSDHDVPVMDLFTGNFNIGSDDEAGGASSAAAQRSGHVANVNGDAAVGADAADASWSNFADFESSDDMAGAEESSNQPFGGAEEAAEDPSFDAKFADFTFSDHNCLVESLAFDEENEKSEEAGTVGAPPTSEQQDKPKDPFGDETAKFSIEDVF